MHSLPQHLCACTFHGSSSDSAEDCPWATGTTSLTCRDTEVSGCPHPQCPLVATGQLLMGWKYESSVSFLSWITLSGVVSTPALISGLRSRLELGLKSPGLAASSCFPTCSPYSLTQFLGVLLSIHHLHMDVHHRVCFWGTASSPQMAPSVLSFCIHACPSSR